MNLDLQSSLLKYSFSRGVKSMEGSEYKIDLNNNIIKCSFSGFISAEDLIDFISEVRRDPNFHKGLNTST